MINAGRSKSSVVTDVHGADGRRQATVSRSWKKRRMRTARRSSKCERTAVSRSTLLSALVVLVVRIVDRPDPTRPRALQRSTSIVARNKVCRSDLRLICNCAAVREYAKSKGPTAICEAVQERSCVCLERDNARQRKSLHAIRTAGCVR